ncbi:MAG: CsoS2 family carboxysome shell protein [Acidimicrobiales bacterium]
MGMYAVQTADPGELAALRDAAGGGRAVAMSRRRALAAGRAALAPAHERVRTGLRQAELRGSPTVASAPPRAASGHAAPSVEGGPSKGAVSTPGDVPAANVGRNLSMARRRQLSQGKQALGVRVYPAADDAVSGAPPVAGDQADNTPAPAADAVAAAVLGRNLSMARRRQLSQGKQALGTGVVLAPAAAGAGVSAPAEHAPADSPGSCRELARARRSETSRFGSANVSRPQREGRVRHALKVTVSPTRGGQRVTGLRIGPGLRVTGDEPGASLGVTGSQYVAADGAAPASIGGSKVGLVRTPLGLVVSGTTVRGTVAITGDGAGEHLTITGEADQRCDDDLTPRSGGSYRSAQFPRRADPQGATALGTRLRPQPATAASGGDLPWHPLETSDAGLAVTGTGVGRSGRVTGNEAGSCRPISGDQYQGLASNSSECAGTGGGTAPAAHLNRPRLDPATGSKVTVAQTWSGQRVTGPSVEHQPNVTGDEPGVCGSVSGTAYQGPSTAFGWCEPDQSEAAAGRLDSRPAGVAVTGDVPMHAQAVTGTHRGHRHNVTGTSYYSDLRVAEPAADDWAGGRAFPVALARRLAGGEETATPDTDNPTPPASGVPGRITGSFASGEGKVTGNNEFLFRTRLSSDAKPLEVTGEGRTEGRTVTGSAWTAHSRVTGTVGYIAAGRNPTEGGGRPHGWAGAGKFRDLATPGGPRQTQNVTGLSGWSAKAAARVTLSGGAQG